MQSCYHPLSKYPKYYTVATHSAYDKCKRIHTAVGVSELFNELQTLLKSSENSEFALKGILSEEQIERRIVIGLSALPVRIGHSDLIEI